MNRIWSTKVRAGLAILSGAIAILSLAGLILAYLTTGPTSTLAWTLGKVSLVLIGVSGVGSLAAGGKRGILGFASGIVCLGAGLGALNIFWGWGAWALLLGVAFLVLAVATPGLALAAGLDRWRLPA